MEKWIKSDKKAKALDKPFVKEYNVVFTININAYGIDMFDEIYKNNIEVIRYLIVGEEISKTGYRHYQCYVQLFRQIRMKGFKKLMNYEGTHLEVQYGTNLEARNYCWKGQFELKGTEYPQPSSITKTFGRFCEGQGERTEMLDIKELLDDGVGHYDIVNTRNVYFNSYGRYHSWYEKYKCMADDERLNIMRKTIDVWALYGPGGTGKTESILRKYGCKNCYILKNPNRDNKNWNGYESQKILIIDDFYSWLPLSTMQRILDNKPYRVRKLNGYRWAQWDKVYITSNQDPNQWYRNVQEIEGMGEIIDAFKSRIKKCLKVTRGNTNALVIREIILTDIDRHNYKEYLDLDALGL